MPAAMTLISSQTLGSASTVVFSSIPQTYRDLRIVWRVGGTTSTGSGIQFNSDTDFTNNYSRVVMTGNGSTASSFANSGSSNPAANHDCGGVRTDGMLQITVMDYSATDKHKTILSREDAVGNETTAVAMRWASTAAVSSITLTNDGGGALTAGTSIYLYGIAG